MKRILAFLLLFGSGVALLLWLDRPRDVPLPKDPSTQPAVQPDPEVAPPAVAPELPVVQELPVAPVTPPAPAGAEQPGDEQDTGRQGPKFHVEGPVELRYREDTTGLSPVLYFLTSADSRTSDTDPTVIELFDVVVRFYEPAHSRTEPSAVLKAERAQGRISQEAAESLQLALEPTIQLFDVVVTDNLDAPVVPMRVTAAEVEVHLEDRTISTKVPTRAFGPVLDEDSVFEDGPGLQVRAEGLEADLDGGRYRLSGMAHTRMEREDGAVATLECSGPLTVERLSGSKEIEVRAVDDALLVMVSDDGRTSTVDANTLVFLAEAAGSGVQPRRAVGAGAVIHELPGARFFGELGEVEFDATGEVALVTLSGLPAGVVDLETWVGNLPKEREQELYISGLGPLRVDVPAARLQLEGPGSIELGAARLEARDLFDVELPREGSLARMHATGDVRFVDPPYLLETPDLLLTRLPPAGPSQIASLIADASGATHVEGSNDSGDPFTVDAGRGLRVRVRGTAWVVERALDVSFALSGERAFDGHAGEICDLDPEQQSFSAGGNVDATHLDVRLEGVELLALSPESWVLWGEQAVVTGEAGRASADRFERVGNRLVARGSVDADLHQGGLELEVDSELLEVQELPLTDDGRFSTSLLAEGNVAVRYLAGAESSLLEGDVVTGLFHAIDGEKPGTDPLDREWTDALLEAFGNCKAEVLQEEGRYEIHSSYLESRLDRRVSEGAGVEAAGSGGNGGSGFPSIRAGGQEAAPEDETPVVPAPQDGASVGELAEDPIGTFRAEGDVRLIGVDVLLTSATGESLVVDQNGVGTLRAPEGGRATAKGLFADGVRSFDLDAERFEFAPERLEAWDPNGRFWELATEESGGGGLVSDLRGRGDKLVATRKRSELVGHVHVQGTSTTLGAWTLDAGSVVVEGQLDETDTGSSEWERMEAEGGFELDFLAEGKLTGERLEARGTTGVITAYGRPATEDSPELLATLTRAGLRWTSTWIEYDLNHHLPRSGPGQIEILDDASPATLEYTSLDTLVEPDTLIQAMQLPVYRNEEQELRASWVTLWVDRHRWVAFASGEVPRGEIGQSARQLRSKLTRTMAPGTLFEEFRDTLFGDVINEAYFEGPIELFSDKLRVARADALYLDVVEGHGWIAGAHLTVQRQVRGNPQPVEVETDWMRISADGSLRADDARLTTCEFEKPHMYVTTRDLRIEPTAQTGLDYWKFLLRSNYMHLYDTIKVPLPTLRYSADERGRPMLNSFRIGSSGQFGNIFELAFEGDLVRREAKAKAEKGAAPKSGEAAVDGDEGEPDEEAALAEEPEPLPSELPRGFHARYRVRASWLGSRGLLGYGRIRLEPDNVAGHPVGSGSNYWMDFSVGGLADDGEDGGLVKVPLDQRSTGRVWTHARGRYELGEAEWIEMVFNTQTDPGVQSEFWENDYLHFEERNTDVHWRKATNADFFSAQVFWRVDEFRTETQRLPWLQWGHTPTTVAPFLNSNLLYRSNTTAAYLDRVEGNTEYEQAVIPFESARFDTTHRLESPLQTTVAGIKLTPYLEARGTYWSENLEKTDSPTRLALLAGLRIATTLIKRLSPTTTHEIVPFLQLRGDLAVDQQGGNPQHFDDVEDPQEGKFVEVGFRTRWLKDNGHFLDIQLFSGWGTDVGEFQLQGWQPLQVFASWRSRYGDVPFAVFHDGRYDFNQSNAAFSLTQLTFDPSNYWTVVLDYHFADEPSADPYYNAGSVAARHRWTRKWEFEGRQTFSFLEDTTLNTALIVRRYGHDMLVEVEVGQRSGVGGPYFSFGFKPLLGWRGPGQLGQIHF